MQLMVALAPIHREAGIERLVVSTYQSVSGTGQKALEELDAEARASLAGEHAAGADDLSRTTIAFNVIGAAGNFAEGDDHTDEERKMMFETRKILEDPEIAVAVTCVRVPVRVGHSESVNIETREHLPVERAQRAARPGSRADRRGCPLAAALGGPGRGLRRDGCAATRRTPTGLAMFVVADNLRKGAATNAVQIAELLIAENLVAPQRHQAAA